MDNSSLIAERYNTIKEKVEKITAQRSALQSRVTTLEEQRNEISAKLVKDYGIKDMEALKRTIVALSAELEKRVRQAEEAIDKVTL